MNPVNRTPFKIVCTLLVFLLTFSTQPAWANDPCDAYCYDFSCDPNNCSISQNCPAGTDWVPCDNNGANTSPDIDVDAAGTTSFPLTFPGGNCGSALQPAPYDYVAWYTFVVPGSSFEWQIIETGGDDVYYEFYYSTLPADDPNACMNLSYYTCGDDFTSWELIASPAPYRPTRIYLALYSTQPDDDLTVNIKIRKACGESCIDSDIALDVSGEACIVAGSSTQLLAAASGGGGGSYTYLWSPDDGSINDPNIANPTVSPTQTTKYYVFATGADGCPAIDSVVVQVGGCCTTNPQITCPADYDGCPGDDTSPSNTGSATATNGASCGAPVITSSDETISSGPCNGEIIIERTWRAEDPDDPNLYSECVQIITLEADGPTITYCPGDATVSCASAISVDANNVGYTTSCGLGANAIVTGPVVNGDPDCNGTTYTYTYKVTDDCNRTATCQQVFTISNSGPTITYCPGDATVSCASAISVDANNVGYTTSCGLGANAIVTGPVVNGDPDCNGTTYTYTYKVTDDCNRTATCQQVFTISNSGPTITYCPGDATVSCASAIGVDANNVGYTTSCGLGANAIVTGPVVNGDPDCNGTTYTYTYKVTDDCNRTATCQQVFTISNSGPSITCPGDMTVSCVSEINVHPSNANPSTSCTLGYNVSVTGPDITGTSCNGTRTYTYKVTDDCGRTATCQQVFTIDNTSPPTIQPAPGDVTVSCDQPLPPAVDLVVTDACGNTETVSPTSSSTPGSCPVEYSVTRTWTYTDDCNNSVSTSQLISVEDNEGPTFTSVPADVDVCGSPPPPGTATATDNCSNVTITHSDQTIWNDCINGEKIMRTWKATDDCGNTTTAVQMVIFNHDGTPPEFWDCPADIVVDADPDCYKNVSWTPPTATDNCGTPSVVSSHDPGDSFPVGMTVVTYTATDNCGNTAVCTFKVTVNGDDFQIHCPDDINTTCSSAYGRKVKWDLPYLSGGCGNTCTNPGYISGFVYMGELNGHYYYCSTFPSSWSAAKAYAENSGGHLAVINDAQENQFLANLLQAPAAFIGMSDAASEGNFEWVNGDPVTYTNWYPGQPNNYNGAQDYVEMLSNGQWNDQYATCKLEFIMEVPCGNIRQISGPPRGGLFPPGTTEVCYEGSDGMGNTAICCFNVTVNSLTIYCPDDIVVNCYNGYNGANVSWQAPKIKYCGSSCAGGSYIPNFVYMGQYNNHHYYCSTYPANWADAQAASLSNGGYLAVLNSVNESNLLAPMLGSSAWIGLTDEASEGTWNWVNGDPVTYTNWYPGQPNNYNGNQDYGELLNTGQWNDQYGHEKREFIMEMPCTRIKQIAGPPSGSWFDEGTHTITYVGLDGSGNSDTCSFTVTVNCSNNNDDYCDSGSSSSYYTWIQRIKLPNIDNNSGNDGGYGNYSHLSANVTKGQSYFISLYPGYLSPYPVYWKIWADWNHDGDFYDSYEYVGYATNTYAIQGSFAVPSIAKTGKTRMRISMSYGGYCSGPCVTFGYGEVEDYSLWVNDWNIVPGGGQDVVTTAPHWEAEDLEEAMESLAGPAPDMPTGLTIIGQLPFTPGTANTSLAPPAGKEIKVYPNPTDDELMVNLAAFAGEEGQLQAFNSLGQLVFERYIDEASTQALSIDVKSLAEGVYFIKWNAANEKNSQTESFVIQRR